MTRQIAVRIPDDLHQEVERLVDEGRFATVAEAVRAGLAALVARDRDRALDEAIVRGYRAHPPTVAEEAWADRSGRDLIAEEPW